jgi:hypothetical protein
MSQLLFRYILLKQSHPVVLVCKTRKIIIVADVCLPTVTKWAHTAVEYGIHIQEASSINAGQEPAFLTDIFYLFFPGECYDTNDCFNIINYS